jgi:predicted transcriptional regulator
MNIEVSTKNMAFLECFSSETRIKMIELLNVRPMNIKELAETLNISSAIVTKHVQKLEEAGILSTQSISGKRGRQKVCSLLLNSVTLQLNTQQKKTDPNRYSVHIPIGQYSNYQVKPTCGLASENKIIGMVDDPRYFTDPEHVKAMHLWFGSGFVEYRIPNFLLRNQKINSLEISLEICSEAPGYNESWPSDISFYVNDNQVGIWTCPGDFGDTSGVYTPGWWSHGTQHGLWKTIAIYPHGSFIDGIKFSNKTINDLALKNGEDIHFRIACHETALNCGGVSLFGKQFGNYNQDIVANIIYTQII